MNPFVNETHHPQLRSWIESANVVGGDFPIQNLPFGAVRRRESDDAPRVGVAIGDQILDVVAALDAGCLSGVAADAAARCRAATLNPLLALGPPAWSALRLALSRLLRRDGAGDRPNAAVQRKILVPMRDAELVLPVAVGNYTDFYASVHHATNVGSMFRPDNPLLPNYKWVPIGYHGRASSIVVSGTTVHRPTGQTMAEGATAPTVGPSARLDYELELGAIVGSGNALGRTIPIGEAGAHLFGVVVLNDWSARDMQAWEYQPLGPFLAKSFASSISPWVVTLEALAPFRTAAYARAAGDPVPLPYLSDAQDAALGAFDISLEVALCSARMRDAKRPPHPVSHGRATDLYWTLAQLVAHHASNGCNLQPGDVLGTGTISGSTKESRGSLLELAWRGTEPVQLPGGEERRFLLDGDEVVMRAWCEREGATRIGFGECRGLVVGAVG